MIQVSIKRYFKENQTYRNRYRQIWNLSFPKIHSKLGHVQDNSSISFDHRVVRVVADVS